MPVTTEKRTPKVNRRLVIAMAVGVLLALLSLPAALTLFPNGIRVGKHGVHGQWFDPRSGTAATPRGMVDDPGPVTVNSIEFELMEGVGKSYLLTYW